MGLISNSADALEKARFHSVQDESYLGDAKDLEVKIEHDPDQKTLSIIDTGVGMSKADLLAKVKADKDDKAALDSAQVLFQTALLESGYEIADPSALVNHVYRLMSKELNVDPDAPIKEVEVPEGEEEEEAEEEDKDESDDDKEDDKDDKDDGEKKEEL